jgi:branched-chain amino acid transport system ATP-binding protein
VTARLRVAGLRAAHGGRQVLDVEELVIDEPELTVVLGGAGSGKSTLAAALAGSINARGRVELDGRLLTGTPSQRRRLGLSAALRDAAPLAGCTVAEALHLAARGGGRDRQVLERFAQLGTRRRVACQLLSGGEQQLLRIAAAWCAAPRVLVLDSPTVGLAGDAEQAVAALAREEVERGALVLWLESDARAAPGGARFTLSAGRLVAVSSPASAGAGSAAE